MNSDETQNKFFKWNTTGLNSAFLLDRLLNEG